MFRERFLPCLNGFFTIPKCMAHSVNAYTQRIAHYDACIIPVYCSACCDASALQRIDRYVLNQFISALADVCNVKVQLSTL